MPLATSDITAVVGPSKSVVLHFDFSSHQNCLQQMLTCLSQTESFRNLFTSIFFSLFEMLIIFNYDLASQFNELSCG